MSDRKISILLIGTGSLLNYGCEAIVQGTYYILKQYLPDSQIYLASDDFSFSPSGVSGSSFSSSLSCSSIFSCDIFFTSFSMIRYN